MAVSVWDVARVWLVVGMIAVVLAGLGMRGRLTACVTFVAYLVVVAVSDGMIVTWPETYYRRPFWILKESVLGFLKLAMGLELMVRIFRHFPGAYTAARLLVVFVVIALGFLVWSAASDGVDYLEFVGRLHPYVNDGMVWLLVALGAASLWYHLPLDSIHKAILIGLVPFLLVYSVALRALAAVGWERGDLFNLTGPLAYLAVIVYWARVAWRRDAGDSGTRVKRMMPSAA